MTNDEFLAKCDALLAFTIDKMRFGPICTVKMTREVSSWKFGEERDPLRNGGFLAEMECRDGDGLQAKFYGYSAESEEDALNKLEVKLNAVYRDGIT